MQILLYLCTRNKSTPWDCVFIGWAITRHNKGVITRYVIGYLKLRNFQL